MDLLRAAFLLESQLPNLPGLPSWKRRELENIADASVRAMREAAARIEQLEQESAVDPVRMLPRAQQR